MNPLNDLSSELVGRVVGNELVSASVMRMVCKHFRDSLSGKENSPRSGVLTMEELVDHGAGLSHLDSVKALVLRDSGTHLMASRGLESLNKLLYGKGFWRLQSLTLWRVSLVNEEMRMLNKCLEGQRQCLLNLSMCECPVGQQYLDLPSVVHVETESVELEVQEPMLQSLSVVQSRNVVGFAAGYAQDEVVNLIAGLAHRFV